MIIFYNKKTKETIGTIDGRVHPKNHFVGDNGMDVLIVPSGVDTKDIGRLIIGWIEEVSIPGQPTQLIEHNHHLFHYLIEFEDPQNPKTPFNHRVHLDTQGNVTDLLPKD